MNEDKHSNKFIKVITSKIFTLISSEINKPDTQVLVRKQIILPIINIIYSELYPYIIALVTTMTIILIISILTLVFFIFAYLKKS